jgi:hypothetical protein
MTRLERTEIMIFFKHNYSRERLPTVSFFYINMVWYYVDGGSKRPYEIMNLVNMRVVRLLREQIFRN